MEETDIPRLRISSLGVEFVDEKMLQIFQNSRVVPYIHLSVQSAADNVLKRMIRNYSTEKLLWVAENLQNLKRSDSLAMNIGADIIVGFPGETEADFLQTKVFVQKYITQLHAFPFSAHGSYAQVPAAKMDAQVKQNNKEMRLKELLAIGETNKQVFQKRQNGKILHALIEKVTDDDFAGTTENYIDVTKANFVPMEGSVLQRGKVIAGKLIIDGQKNS